MIKQRNKLAPVVAFLACAGIATACLWDRDTITDELQTRATQYDLVMGQFPSHGEAYYLKRIEKLEPGANKDALLWSESNDLAVAYIRTKQFNKAVVILSRNLKAKPKDYHTLSNLGVLYKKQGDYGNAVDYMRNALKIKPEGHMGLGDWYLKRLEWSMRYETNPGVKPEVNFLGEKYAETYLKYLAVSKTSDADVKRAQYLTKLIKNDRHFADGYLVMGDLLWKFSHLNLAMRCYQHALHLGHPNPDVLIQRVDAIIHHWAAKPYSPERKMVGIEKRRAEQKKIFLTELKQTDKWLSDFHAAEARLVAQGKTPTFDQTAAQNKTKRFRPITKPTAKRKTYRGR